MRSTGIVRRIDELGRVVIPKEIRRTMRIREGEELEVFTGENGALILKKYSAVSELKSAAEEYASALYKANGFTAIICDNDEIIAASGSIKNYKAGSALSKRAEMFIEERKSAVFNGREIFPISGDDTNGVLGIAAAPIIRAGDVLGGVFAVSNKPLNDNALKLVETAALFFGRN